MNWIQIIIMWGGIAAILVRAVHRLTGHHEYLYFWEYTLVVTVLTVGLVLTAGFVSGNERKEQRQ